MEENKTVVVLSVKGKKELLLVPLHCFMESEFKSDLTSGKLILNLKYTKLLKNTLGTETQ